MDWIVWIIAPITLCIVGGIILSTVIWMTLEKCPKCRSHRIQVIEITEVLQGCQHHKTRMICSKCYEMFDRFRGRWRKVK